MKNLKARILLNELENLINELEEIQVTENTSQEPEKGQEFDQYLSMMLEADQGLSSFEMIQYSNKEPSNKKLRVV